MAGTFFLVDGTALAYRSHFAFINNPLKNSRGEETSATFGYVRALLDILRSETPDCVVVAFDVSRDTFRKEMYPEYKATREKAPEEMKAQFPWIKQITEALGIAGPRAGRVRGGRSHRNRREAARWRRAGRSGSSRATRT